MSEEWKVVPGYYPGFLEIVGASFKVSVVTDASNLTLEDHIARVRDTNIMAAGKDLLIALEGMMQVYGGIKWDTGAVEIELQELAKKAIAKARGQV